MTEKEQQLIADLTKQLELSNKIAMKQMQIDNMENEKMNNAEIAYMEAKRKLCCNASDVLGIIAVILTIGSILAGLIILSGLEACASFF